MMDEIKFEMVEYYNSMLAYLPGLILGLVILFISGLFANAIKNKLSKVLVSRSIDPLIAKFIGRIVKAKIVVIGFSFFLKTAGLGHIAAGLIGTAGIGVFVIGFAFKNIGENFLAGFILAFNRPFNIGDLVELNGEKGNIVGLNMRDTHLKTFDGRDVFIPNANIIKNTLVNYTIDGFIRNHSTIGIDYISDIKKAIKVINDTLNALPGVLQELKSPSLAIDSLGKSSINLNAYYWMDTFDKSVNGSNVKIEIVERILSNLEHKEFYMPREIIEFKNYNNISLKKDAKE
ncbi:MAG: small conductance mechanosensitive channel [Saprospiraceae bacterium]|jgi:small conductance mechanosensitive channel